jgi:hypothetical protein
MELATNSELDSQSIIDSLSYINDMVVSACSRGEYRTFINSPHMNDNMMSILINTYEYNVTKKTNDMGTYATYIVDWSNVPVPPTTLLLHLDSGEPLSYPGTGTTWTDLVGGKEFTLRGSPEYVGFLTFNGTNQWADTPTSLPLLPTWTVEVWQYYTGTNTGDAPTIVSEAYLQGGSYGINYALGCSGFSPPNNANVAASFYNGNWYYTNTGYSITTPNAWYHIVGSFDGTNLKLYVNGGLGFTQEVIGQTLSSNESGIRLMRRWDGAEYWGGGLMTVKIYDGAISDSQVASNFNNEKSRYGF